MTYTTTNRKRTSIGSHAHQVSVIEQTDIEVDGIAVCTITWNGPLLRRLEAKGETREQYIERMAARHITKEN